MTTCGIDRGLISGSHPLAQSRTSFRPSLSDGADGKPKSEERQPTKAAGKANSGGMEIHVAWFCPRGRAAANAKAVALNRPGDERRRKVG